MIPKTRRRLSFELWYENCKICTSNHQHSRFYARKYFLHDKQISEWEYKCLPAFVRVTVKWSVAHCCLQIFKFNNQRFFSQNIKYCFRHILNILRFFFTTNSVHFFMVITGNWNNQTICLVIISSFICPFWHQRSTPHVNLPTYFSTILLYIWKYVSCTVVTTFVI